MSDISGMTSPVRCAHCGKVYDMGKVEIAARYTDCTMWKAPCCGTLVDDRGETGWKSKADYTRLDVEHAQMVEYCMGPGDEPCGWPR